MTERERSVSGMTERESAIGMREIKRVGALAATVKVLGVCLSS